MWEFLSNNLIWILFIGGMVIMHLGHGGHGGHGGGHQHGQAFPQGHEEGAHPGKGGAEHKM